MLKLFCLKGISCLLFLRRLNAELEERTASLIKEAEEVMVNNLHFFTSCQSLGHYTVMNTDTDMPF